MKNQYCLLLLLASLIWSCSGNIPDLGKLQGFTQGTTYSIIYDGMARFPVDTISEGVRKILRGIDMSLSVYNDSSVISKINRNEEVIMDTFFLEVFRKSQVISELTGGAFDITVMPLVKAWGFGPDEHKNFDRSKRDSLLNLVGFRKIKQKGNRLIKTIPAISLDANAIAQGYTVDVVCRYFDQIGLKNYLVEIGGEVRVKGKKGRSNWKIGIDRPADLNMVPGSTIQAIIELSDRALATSGNYRKFYIEDGVKYSHTIDPVTGYPARNRLLSATIVMSDCASADGFATACMVMGLERSIEFIKSNPQMEGYLIYSDEKGNYATWISENLRTYLSEEPEPMTP